MLKQISIDGFKCFDSETIPLNGLTLFAGRNSMGKSTVIQAILAMLQNGENPFMGNYIKLGTISELKNKYVGSKKIKIGLDYELDGIDYHYSKEIEMDDKPINVDGKLENQLTLRYLTADRKGVAAVYPKAIDANDEIGIDCRYAFDFLAKHERDPIQNETNSPVLIPLDEEGKALVQKEYLFDQIKKDLDVLLGW